MADNNTLQQVLFKKGSQNNLNNLGPEAISPGTFYITEDSHRIYFGVTEGGKNKVVPLSSVVTVLSSESELPGAGTDAAKNLIGQLVYLQNENILCITSNGDSWVQINPDTNTFVDRYTTATTGDDEGNVQITSLIHLNDGAEYQDSIAVVAGDHIVLSAGEKTLTIACDIQYDLSTVANETSGQITLSNGTVDEDDNILITGSNGIKVTSNGNNEITVDGKTLNDANISESNIAFSDTGVLSTSLKTLGGTDITGTTVTPTIKLGENANVYTFISGTATLPVYTKEEVDGQLNRLDAVRYKGVISSDSELSELKKVQIGDAYKLTADNIAYKDRDGANQSNTKTGDLLIAYGIEENGYITSDSLGWDLIPSGDDLKDTLYSGVVIQGVNDSGEHGIYIKDSGGTNVAQLTIQRNNEWININSTLPQGSEATKDKINIQVTHKEFKNATLTPTSNGSETQEALTDKQITYVDGVTRDKAGHIIGYTTKTTTLTDTNGDLTENSISVAQTTVQKKVTIQNTTQFTNSKGAHTSLSDNFSLESVNSNLQLNANTDTKNITIGLVWGSF